MTITDQRPPVPTALYDPQNLISAELYERLVTRIVADDQMERVEAERIMRQALAFLKACANNPNAALSPSPKVDIGWHTFILYTRHYAEFCRRVAGRFIHHEPTDSPSSGPGASLADTAIAIERAGYAVDTALWTITGSADCEFENNCTNDCSQCHKGCADSN